MSWVADLLSHTSAAQTVLLVSVVAALGLAIGSVKVRDVGLGVAGVLFAGLLVGHVLGDAGIELDPHVMEFVREFGLILFVYAIGMQVGPGFFGSLRRDGLPLNLMAAGTVLLGVVVTVCIAKFGGVEAPAAVGLYSGAVTNTPSLAAAQQALKDVPELGPEVARLPGMAYAVAYPFGIMGIILTMLLARAVFRVDVNKELAQFEAAASAGRPQVASVNLEVTNPNLEGVPLSRVPVVSAALAAGGGGVVVSRVSHGGEVTTAGPGTILHVGDALHAVGEPAKLEELKLVVGREASVDVKALPTDIASRRVIVSNREPLGKTLGELELFERFGVTVTRVNRAGVELPARPGLKLQYADNLVVVGGGSGLDRLAKELGDSQKQLQHPHMVPIFVGIAIGVFIGSWPVLLPGMPGAVKLGLAGGPLLVAILLSRLHNVGPLVFYLPLSANTMLKELGIILFLSAVGLRSGAGFLETVLQGDGLYWMALGVAITLLPLLVVAAIARLFLRTNYLSLCGLLAGSMTDPPALAFAQTIAGGSAPAVSYATVYPLVMILRVLSGQLMIMFLMR